MTTDSLDAKKAHRLEKLKQEQLEINRCFEALELEDSKTHEVLKADFRLEELLLFTESPELRIQSLKRLFAPLETLRQKENLDRNQEFLVIHLLLTAGEVLKLHHQEEGIADFALKIYSFSLNSSSVVSGIAHQKFLEVLSTLNPEQKRGVTSKISDLLEATR